MSGIRALSLGDCGDLFAGVLGVLSTIPGKHTVLLRDHVPPEHATKGIVKRAHLVIPFIKSQSYIEDCRVCSPEEQADWRSQDFRRGFHQSDCSLLESHARHAVSVGVIKMVVRGENAWLTAKKDKRSAGRILINRSPRYNNYLFKWRSVVNHYDSRILFIGLPNEHRMFCNEFGEVEYLATKDFLEIAQLIAGCELLIGNQSACMTIAEGLKKRRILECSLSVCDCIYPGAHNAQYVGDGSILLPDVDGSGILEIPCSLPKYGDFNRQIVPPGGWVFAGFPPSNHFSQRQADIARNFEITMEQADERLFQANVERLPDYFANTQNKAQLYLYNKAIANANL